MTSVKLRVLGECAIEVGGHVIAPDAPQLFASILFLCCADGRPVHRSELVEVIFPAEKDAKKTSHNLRQLLYRLRRLGAPLVITNDVIRLPRHAVCSSLQEYEALPRLSRLSVPASHLSILPSYHPALTLQLGDWVETARSQFTARVRAVLRDDFRAYQSECQWEHVVSIAGILQVLNSSSDELVAGLAEALFMLGRKNDALDALDRYASEDDSISSPELRKLRQKLVRSQGQTRTLESAFYGRTEVMTSLIKQWTRAAAGHKQLAVITGPAGIGKSRVAREFNSYARLHGAQCVAYRCDNSDAARPLALFRNLLPLLRSMRGSLGATPSLQHHLGRLAADARPEAPLAPATSEATRADIQFALIDLLDAVASETALAIWVDDAHLLDAASAAVLNALFERHDSIAVMLVCCHRGSQTGPIRVTSSTHCRIHHLTPLSDDAGLQVMKELLPRGPSDDAFLRSCVERSGGNPYYLHAIAYATRSDHLTDPTPFDIKQFAATSYFGLSSDSRALFEVCLLLGSFATIERVRAIAEVDGPALVAALRDLETSGMLYFSGSELRCAHALLAEAAYPLIPTAVAALIHHRIAQALEMESASRGYPTALTWAAAEGWLTSGDAERAAALLMRCAAQAAAVGEVRSAANTLMHIQLAQLLPQDRPAILNKIVEYSEAAGDSEQVLNSLRALQSLARELGSNAELLREHDFRVIEAELRHGAAPYTVIEPLLSMLNDEDASRELRLRAGIRLLIAADVNLDVQLAQAVYKRLTSTIDECEPLAALREQAEVVYHTVFGDQDLAVDLSKGIISRHPSPSLAQSGMSARRNAGFALNRMGRGDLARPILRADCDFMLERHVTSEALFNMNVLAESALSDGDLTSAQAWLQKAAKIIEREPQPRALQGGYFCAAAGLAVVEGRLADAEYFVNEAHARFSAMRCPRYEAIEIAIRLRIAFARGGQVANDALARLRELYLRGGRLGAQDVIVEVLWLAATLQGDPETAHKLLCDYLSNHRRERGAPEWSLWNTSKTDTAWTTNALLLTGTPMRASRSTA
jgi:DNA-binding SARP family transcriptional activator/tetratricopeptide (TPR) repeat protein